MWMNRSPHTAANYGVGGVFRNKGCCLDSGFPIESDGIAVDSVLAEVGKIVPNPPVMVPHTLTVVPGPICEVPVPQLAALLTNDTGKALEQSIPVPAPVKF